MACSSPNQSSESSSVEVKVTQEPAVKVIDVIEFEAKLNSGNVQVIDVRTDGEVAEGVIPGAIQIDISDRENFEAEIAKLDKDRDVLVYCKVGGRSAQAASYMESQGFSKVYDLKGGILAWNGAGKDIKELEK